MIAIMNQFKAIAPYIVEAVKVRVAPGMTTEEVMAVIHEEILAYFEKGQKMAAEALTFSAEQKATFSAVMYDMLKPLADQMAQQLNPVYAEYVQRTGKTGALNFITNAS